MTKNSEGDKRILKTRAKLRKALFTQMQRKGVHDISVHEITDLAGLNRSTFYLHYENVESMLEQIVAEISEDFFLLIKKHLFSDHNPSRLNYLTELFQLHAKHSDFFLVLFGTKQESDLSKSMESFLKKIINDLMQARNPQCRAKFEYHFQFFAYGFKKIAIEWILSDMRESAEEMAATTLNIVCLDGIM